MKRLIVLSSCKHLGDYTTLTSALYNLHKAFPEHDYTVDFRGLGYRDLFKNNPLVTQNSNAVPWPMKLHYEQRVNESEGTYGVYPLGFHKMAERSMTALCGSPVKFPAEKVSADFYIRPEEYEEYPIPYKNYCILNANSQVCADVKAYPYYQEVVDLCPDIQFLQIGGDSRDIATPAVKGAIDLRGKTTVRQLVLLASRAKYILSGPSGIVHIGSAFPQVKKIVVIGAREPTTLWTYPNTFCMISRCGRFGGLLGCMKMHFGPGQCDRYCSDKYKKYPLCMADITPEEIAEELCTA